MIKVFLTLAVLTVAAFSQPAATPAQPSGNTNASPAPEGHVDFVKKLIDSPLQDIQWTNPDTVFVITEKGNLYRSTNAGRSWVSQMNRMPTRIVNAAKVDSMFISEVDSNKILFLTNGKGFWYTQDMGESYSEGSLALRDVRLHPTQSTWLLGSTMSPGCTRSSGGSPAAAKRGSPVQASCFKVLHVSKDFGATWNHAVDYIVQFDWSPPVGEKINGFHQSDDLVFATVNQDKKGDQRFGFWDKNIHFVSTYDYFKNYRVLVEHGNRFLFGDYAYLFVAKVDPQDQAQVTLMICRDNETRLNFQEAILPVPLNEHSYTILDTSEGAVFLHVNHKPFHENAYAGHVYTSDWSGLYYSLSLPYNHRSADGKCDFEKVEGLEGVYLANFVDEDEMDEQEDTTRIHDSSRSGRATKSGEAGALKKRHERLHTKTVVTYDKGGDWHFLAAPRVDSEGRTINCGENCYLHLHGITDMYGPFYSAESALGLIMATGSVGPYLQANPGSINTYLSRDAGLSWSEVKKGSHIYEFGDHGGLIVMANDEQASDSILYSWDEGATWTSQKISEEKFQIENIIIEPSATSEVFVIYGWQDQAGVVVFIDFSELHKSTCVGHDAPDSPSSDYETWSPSERLGDKCLMGHKVTYTRRKQASLCFNPEDFERPERYEDCTCKRIDFECDYGYELKPTPESRKPASDRDSPVDPPECVEMDNAPEAPHPFAESEMCKGSSKIFRVTKGYRRVPGNTCIGGAHWDAVESPCPSHWHSSAGKMVAVIFSAAVLGLVLLACTSKYDFAEKFRAYFKNCFRRWGYQLVNRQTAPASPEDEAFLDEDEFARSAQYNDGEGKSGGHSSRGDIQGRGSNSQSHAGHAHASPSNAASGSSAPGAGAAVKRHQNAAATAERFKEPESEFAPLPPVVKGKDGKVPTLQPPESDNDFNPRGQGKDKFRDAI